MTHKKNKLPNLSATSQVIRTIRTCTRLTLVELAEYLGASHFSLARWERGDAEPNAQIRTQLAEILAKVEQGEGIEKGRPTARNAFASRGARRNANKLPLFKSAIQIDFQSELKPPILTRLRKGNLWGDGPNGLIAMLTDHADAAPSINAPATDDVTAGKNTYTYDAHTYHTKVPPQGIAEILKKYLPKGGLVLDPFAGSGMTGVAARVLGIDSILNELSPAASFIADRFTKAYEPAVFSAGVATICNSLRELRRDLYETTCRECGKETEILYTVWSYRVRCNECDHDFLLWDHCRSYGKTVREHKLLAEFPCPQCAKLLKKRRLKRTFAEPVLLGYKCCSRQQIEHQLTSLDLERLKKIETMPPVADGFVPKTELPGGVNLSQPKKHGLISIDRFYTQRNLAAMSQIWRQIHRIEDKELAGFLAFAFTSLYQRVTKLSEFRFWGGSGNTANFNVPYIFNEANVFVTFERKARSIEDHLETTAQAYKGRVMIRTGTATCLDFLPDNSVDMVFTDPPFGANINYSEMNILWESWLGCFTDNTDEAIVNRFQKKDISTYSRLMTESLRECNRVLRHGGWMVLVFMNSSQDVWQSLRDAILSAGFTLERVDTFDKQHGTFKQFVSDNTAGFDLLLHCRKQKGRPRSITKVQVNGTVDTVRRFIERRSGTIPTMSYLHVRREKEIDYRMLYSEFLAEQLLGKQRLLDFAAFRAAVALILT